MKNWCVGMMLFTTLFIRVFSCDLAGDFLCTSRCLDHDGNVDVFHGEKTTITEVPGTESHYTMVVQKGTMYETEHCVGLEQKLICATTNLTNAGGALEVDISYPLINECDFDNSCGSFVKLVRKFDIRTLCHIQCTRNDKPKSIGQLSRITKPAKGEIFDCTGYCFNPDQSITKIYPQRNNITRVVGYEGKFTEVEIGSVDGLYEFQHCGVLPDLSSLCLSINMSGMEAPEVFEKTVFDSETTYTKYIRSITEDIIFVCGAECSYVETNKVVRKPQCSPSGTFNCSGICLDSDGSLVSRGGTTSVEEKMQGLFYKVTVTVGNGAKQVMLCVLDQSGFTPALRCVLSEKSNTEERVAALEEIIYDSTCSSMTKVLRDLNAGSHVAVCKFSCNRV